MRKNSITIIACLFSAVLFAQAVGPGVQPQPQPQPIAPAVGPGAQPQYQQQPQQPVPAQGPGAQQYSQQPPPREGYRHESNESGRDKIAYIDNHGQRAVTLAMPPAGAGANGPQWIAKWRKDKEDGRSEEDGRLYESFGYTGSNGYMYQTRIVATATNDPNNPWMVRFQSKPFGQQGEYMDGRVIVMDWDNNPWIVNVYYSNDKGIYFMFTPFQR